MALSRNSAGEGALSPETCSRKHTKYWHQLVATGKRQYNQQLSLVLSEMRSNGLRSAPIGGCSLILDAPVPSCISRQPQNAAIGNDERLSTGVFSDPGFTVEEGILEEAVNLAEKDSLRIKMARQSRP